MESHDSCEKLVDAEAGLASLKTPQNLSFDRIARRRGSPSTLMNYVFVLFAIALVALVSYETWQMVRSEQLIKQILIENEERRNEEFPGVLEDTRIQDMEKELNRVRSTLMEMQEKSEKRSTIPETSGLPIAASVHSEADDGTQDSKEYGRTLSVDDNIVRIPFDFPSSQVIDEDVIQGPDDYESSVPVMITKSIDETESGSRSRWIINFTFGGNSGERDVIEEEDVIESGDTDTMPPVKSDASGEAWSDYFRRMFSTQFAPRFGMTWGWGVSSKEDSRSSESAEDVEEKIDSIETETMTTPMVMTVHNAPRNYDYRYGDYYDEYEEYERADEEKSSNTDEDSVLSKGTTSVDTPDDRVGSFQEDVEEVNSSTSTGTPTTPKSPSDYENTDDSSQYDNFGKTTGQGAEGGSKSTEVSTEESSRQDDLQSEDSLNEEYFRKLLEKRIAEVAWLDKLYSMIQDSEEYSDYVTERDYGADSSHSSQLIPSTTAVQNSTLESRLASTVQEDLEEDDLSTSTQAPQISESSSEADYEAFWNAFLVPLKTTEEESEDGLKSAGEPLEASSKQDDPLSEQEDIDEDSSDATTSPWLNFKLPEPEEYSDYVDDEYYDDGWSYISKRSVDAPSALEIPSEPISAKEFGRKISILRQAIDDENHLLLNEVSLTSGPTKQVLQSKLNDFYAKMDVVSAHIDRLHERYLRLNKLDDDYVSRELPAAEMDTPWTPVN